MFKNWKGGVGKAEHCSECFRWRRWYPCVAKGEVRLPAVVLCACVSVWLAVSINCPCSMAEKAVPRCRPPHAAGRCG